MNNAFASTRLQAFSPDISADDVITEGDDAAGDESTTYSMAVGDIFQGTVGARGDDDWVAIELVAGRTYRIALNGAEGADGLRDPYLRLYDSEGVYVRGDDDGGSGRDSYMVFTATESGTFYLSARAWRDGGTGNYALTVSQDDLDQGLALLDRALADVVG